MVNVLHLTFEILSLADGNKLLIQYVEEGGNRTKQIARYLKSLMPSVKYMSRYTPWRRLGGEEV
jgi:hypothetical protein